MRMIRRQSRSFISASYFLFWRCYLQCLLYSSRQVNNPATGETVADVARMGVRETNDAIASSYEAFPCM